MNSVSGDVDRYQCHSDKCHTTEYVYSFYGVGQSNNGVASLTSTGFLRPVLTSLKRVFPLAFVACLIRSANGVTAEDSEWLSIRSKVCVLDLLKSETDYKMSSKGQHLAGLDINSELANITGARKLYQAYDDDGFNFECVLERLAKVAEKFAKVAADAGVVLSEDIMNSMPNSALCPNLYYYCDVGKMGGALPASTCNLQQGGSFVAPTASTTMITTMSSAAVSLSSSIYTTTSSATTYATQATSSVATAADRILSSVFTTRESSTTTSNTGIVTSGIGYHNPGTFHAIFPWVFFVLSILGCIVVCALVRHRKHMKHKREKRELSNFFNVNFSM